MSAAVAMAYTDKPVSLPAFKRPSAMSSSALKKEIRDVSRLLARASTSMPTDVRQKLNRKLAALKSKLADCQQGVKTDEMAQRYRMVRFFETKKAERRLLKAAKAYGAGAEDARAALIEAAKDCAYVARFPKHLPYVALYADGALRSESANLDDELLKKQQAKVDELSAGLIDDGLFAAIQKDAQGVVNKLLNRSLKKSTEQSGDDDDESAQSASNDEDEEEGSEEDEDSDEGSFDSEDDENDESDFNSEEYDSEEEGEEGSGSEEDLSESDNAEEDSEEEDLSGEESESEEEEEEESEEEESEEEEEESPKKKKNRRN